MGSTNQWISERSQILQLRGQRALALERNKVKLKAACKEFIHPEKVRPSCVHELEASSRTLAAFMHECAVSSALVDRLGLPTERGESMQLHHAYQLIVPGPRLGSLIVAALEYTHLSNIL